MYAEGIFQVTDDYPDIAYDIAREVNSTPKGHSSFSSDSVRIFRGDVRSVFDELETEEGLERDFPIYFSDTAKSAAEYTHHKIDENDPLLVEAEIPYENIEIYYSESSDIERREVDLEPNTVYLIGSSINVESKGEHMEFVATSIPQEWYSVRNL